MTDWEDIRQDYITGDMGLRPLAQKWGVSFNTLKDRVKRERWSESRREYRLMVGVPLPPTTHHKVKCGVSPTTGTTAVLEATQYVPGPSVQITTTKVYEASEAVLDLLLCQLERCRSMREVRDAAAALKDIKEIQMIRHALDDEEQRARIAKLRAEAMGSEQKTEPVEVVFIGTEEAAT